jgi:apolipoprotein N-acyltransferase
MDRSRVRWLALAVGAALMPFAVHRTDLPLAAWLAPVFVMRFVRDTRLRVGWPLALLVHAVGAGLAFGGGYLPFPTPLLVGLALLFGVVRSTPFALDRALAGRVPPLVRALAFPSAVTALDFLVARGAPFGTWGVAAYGAWDQPALLQLASLTGLWGIAFVVSALAPAVNELWEARADLSPAWRPAAAFAALLAVVLLFEEARLTFARSPAATVAVAAVAPTVAAYEGVFRGLHAGELARGSDADRAAAAERFRPLADDLLARSETAARAGAEVIAWPESTPVLAEDEPALLERAGDLARRHHVHLLVTPWVVRRTDAFPYVENTSVLLGPDGAALWRYHKARPVIVMETARMEPGAAQLAVAETGLGRIASAICQDLDFPWLMRQAGRSGADLLIGPSDDWRAIGPSHARMAVVRAVENGVSLLRPTSNGVSLAVDPYGRVAGAVDAFATDRAPFLLTRLPIGRVPTLYARLGDWFAYLCIAATLALLVPLRRPVGPPAPIGFG